MTLSIIPKMSKRLRTRDTRSQQAFKRRKALNAQNQYRAMPRGGLNVRTGGTVGRFGRPAVYGRPGASTEKKYLDENSGGAINIASGAGTKLVQHFPNVPNGSGPSDRVGRKITVKGLYLKGKITLPTSTNLLDSDQRIRLMIYIDTQHNGAATGPNLASLLQASDIDAFYNLDETGRYKYIYDKVHTLNQTGSGNGTTSAAYTICRNFKINLPMDCMIQYSGSTGAITGITNNNIGMHAVCDNIISVAPTIEWHSRLRYID